MRVISGIYKGRQLKGYTLKGTRPTMDRVKESLFDILGDKVEKSVCLDLFAGSGNLGIEALSRGAKFGYFVDREYMAYKTIKDNLSLLNILNAEVLNMDYLKALERLNTIKFDIIFLDPPYKSDYLEKAVRKISDLRLLNDKGIVVLESDDINKLYYNDYFREVVTRKYGDKYIRIIERN